MCGSLEFAKSFDPRDITKAQEKHMRNPGCKVKVRCVQCLQNSLKCKRCGEIKYKDRFPRRQRRTPDDAVWYTIKLFRALLIVPSFACHAQMFMRRTRMNVLSGKAKLWPKRRRRKS
jgi:hypothetical protein